MQVAITPRKQQIEEKATELFRTKGYVASSMRDLAGILGIEAASLYSHIRSKEQILQKICFTMADKFFQSVEGLKAATPEIHLALAIKGHFKVISENLDASAVFFNEWRHLSEPFLSDFLELRHQYENLFLEIIKKGIEGGVFRQIDEKFAMMTILSSVNWTHQWYRPTGKMTVEEIGEELSKLMINGLIKTK